MLCMGRLAVPARMALVALAILAPMRLAAAEPLRLPMLSGYTLAGEEVGLPGDLPAGLSAPGAALLLILSLSDDELAPVQAWQAALATAAVESGLPVWPEPITVVIMGDTGRFLRGARAGRLRADIVDPVVRARTVPVFQSAAPVLRALDLPGSPGVVALLVDAEGRVLWLHAGPPGGTDLAALNMRLVALSEGRPVEAMATGTTWDQASNLAPKAVAELAANPQGAVPEAGPDGTVSAPPPVVREASGTGPGEVVPGEATRDAAGRPSEDQSPGSDPVPSDEPVAGPVAEPMPASGAPLREGSDRQSGRTVFPTLAGYRLDGEPITLPQDMLGGPALLLIRSEIDPIAAEANWRERATALGLAPSRMLSLILLDDWGPLRAMQAGRIRARITDAARRRTTVPLFLDAQTRSSLPRGSGEGKPLVILIDAVGNVAWTGGGAPDDPSVQTLDRTLKWLRE